MRTPLFQRITHKNTRCSIIMTKFASLEGS